MTGIDCNRLSWFDLRIFAAFSPKDLSGAYWVAFFRYFSTSQESNFVFHGKRNDLTAGKEQYHIYAGDFNFEIA